MNSQAEQIKARLDIVSYISNSRVQLKREGRGFTGLCPFHHEKSPSFKVNPDTQSWRCFGSCAEGGDIFAFAMKHNNWTFAEALQELADLAGVTLEKQAHKPKVDNSRFYAILEGAAVFYHECLLKSQEGLEYLYYRGYTDKTISEWRLGYAPKGFKVLSKLGYSEDDLLKVGLVRETEKYGRMDVFSQRLMIPIADEQGRVVGFGGRAMLEGQKAKYVNSPTTDFFDKSSILFGLDKAKNNIRLDGASVIVEGYFDVITAHQAGYTNVVAQMGTALSETHLRKLQRYASKIILCLDNDSAGRNATARNMEVVSESLKSDYLSRLDIDLHIAGDYNAKDPDEAIKRDSFNWGMLASLRGTVDPDSYDAEYPYNFRLALYHAKSASDYLIDNLAEQGKGKSAFEKYKLAESALPLINSLKNDDFRGDIKASLSAALGISVSNLEVKLAEKPRKPKVQDSKAIELEKCFFAGILQNDFYFAFTRRAMHKCGLGKLNADIFHDSEFMSIYLQSLDQDDYDYDDYCKRHTDKTFDYWLDETISENETIRAGLILVLRNLEMILVQSDSRDLARLGIARIALQDEIAALA